MKKYFMMVIAMTMMTIGFVSCSASDDEIDVYKRQDEGRIEEKIYNEYMELGLRYPPTFTQVSTTEEAAAVLRSTRCV